MLPLDPRGVQVTVTSSDTDLVVEVSSTHTVTVPRVGPLAVIRSIWVLPEYRPHLAPDVFEAP